LREREKERDCTRKQSEWGVREMYLCFVIEKLPVKVAFGVRIILFKLVLALVLGRKGLGFSGTAGYCFTKRSQVDDRVTLWTLFVNFPHAGTCLFPFAFFLLIAVRTDNWRLLQVRKRKCVSHMARFQPRSVERNFLEK